MQNSNFDFNNLFIFDLANNHQGIVQHGINIIEALAKVTKDNDVRAAIKFQFRELDTFIHPAQREHSSNKHIPRFLSTRLTTNEFELLVEKTKGNGLITISTPFDEASVELIEELNIDVIKIASCSASDWPLLEKVSTYNKPVIFSIGGLNWEEIDNLVSFFEHKRVHFAIMHCVSIYPTPSEYLQLNQIDLLRQRYPKTTIGFSTHESPDELLAITIAASKGAMIFERHVGIETEEIKLNHYSSTPEQIGAWIKSYKRSSTLMGNNQRLPASNQELNALSTLARGVYAKHDILSSTSISREDVFFAMPCSTDQLTSSSWMEGIKSSVKIAKSQPLLLSETVPPTVSETKALYSSVHEIKAMLNEARIALSTDFELEFSHHYGISSFDSFGATIITCINRTYCKKLIVQLEGQKHPTHYHRKKEETFQVLFGKLDVIVEKSHRHLIPGDTCLIQQGVWHEFWTDTGVIFEEISTTHFNDDSFYQDKKINEMERSERKTVVNQWGRFQL